jgi:hypothetical protein
MDPEKIKPPFSNQDQQDIQKVLDDAGINPKDHFTVPQNPDPKQPGRFTNPAVPEGRIKENYNGQKGNGTFTELHFNEWQPDCGEPFAIVISEVWTPPPAGLAVQFQLWAAFATVRAILVCLRNERRCRLVKPLGCESAWDIRFPNGEHYARARFVFECFEI